MDVRIRFAWNLRRLRVEQGISQEALAVDADIDRTHVSRLERGKENPTLAVMDRLAAALKVSICDLLVEVSGRKPPVLPKGRRKRR